MADEGSAPQPLPAPYPQTRPRRAPAKPKVRYRRSPGAASKPVPRTVPRAPGAGGRLLGLARFIPFRGFVDLFFGGVSLNAERAAATQQSALDYAAERAYSRLARGTERRVVISPRPTPNPLTPEIRGSVRAAADRVAPKPDPLPDPVLQAVGSSSVALEIFGATTGNFGELAGEWTPPAGVPRTPSLPEKLLDLPPLPRFTQLFSSPLENPLLTPFEAPGVGSSPLANPLMLAEPMPNAEPDRCRCRALKRKAGKPGKGFFRINSRGEERRQYWRK